MAVIQEDFDIYGDLDDALQPLLYEKKEIPIPEPEEDKVSEVLMELQKENEKLKNENLLLTKNVSILLLTAKAEIERKDNQIKELRKEKDEIVFRKHKKNIHTAEKWSQTSSNSTRDNGSQTLGDKIDNRRTSRDSRDYHKRPRSNERRSNRDEKSRRRSRSRDRRKRSRSSSRNNRYDSGRNNEKRPRINYPSSTESRYSQSKPNSNEDTILEEKPKVLGAYDDISPIKRQSGDASMHLFSTVPIELNVKSTKIDNVSETKVNGDHLKEVMPIKLNFESSEVVFQPENTIKSKPLMSSQKVAVTSKGYRIPEKTPTNPIDKLKSHLNTKKAITSDVVPSASLSSLKTEIKQEPTETKMLIPKQEPVMIHEKKLVVTPLNVVKSPIAVVKSPITIKTPVAVVKSPVSVKTLSTVVKPPITVVKSPIAVVKSPIAVVKSPIAVVKSPVSIKTLTTVVESPLTVVKTPQQVVKSSKTIVKIPVVVVKSPLVAIKSESPAVPSLSPKSPVFIKSELSPPKLTVPTLKSPIILKSALKENGIPTPVVPTGVIIKTEQKVELLSSPEVAEKIKIESISPTVWENSNSTYRKEIVDGAEVIKIVRKPRIKKRKVVVN